MRKCYLMLCELQRAHKELGITIKDSQDFMVLECVSFKSIKGLVCCLRTPGKKGCRSVNLFLSLRFTMR
jgi:hypothetical protein